MIQVKRDDIMSEIQNTAKLTIGETYATVWFTKLTEPELKDALKKLPWVKWQKKEEEEKTRWYLHVDLSDRETDKDEDGQTRLQKLYSVLSENKVNCSFRTYDESEYSTDANKYVRKKNGTKKYFLWMQPNYYEKLRDLAVSKGMSFSQLIVCATDEYIRNEMAAAPLKTTAKSDIVVDSFSEKVRIEMARAQTKPAWVADKLNIPRSRFYGKLDSNNWSEEEKQRIQELLGFK